MAADSAEPSTAAGMAEFYERLEKAHLAPLWESLAALTPPEPRPRARPFKWTFADVRAHLADAGELISAEQAERRVVVLDNPALEGALQATDTLYAGVQLILPGERAPPHRHTQAALRFVLEGQGAFTAVDGRKVAMRPGDFIITPAWRWHEHGGGSDPVIWLDGLDVPLVGFLRAGFREEPGGGTADITRDAATFAWPFAEARAALDRNLAAGEIDPWLGVRHDYVHADGRPAMPTLGASLMLLPAGFTTRPYRSTDSAVACLVEGRIGIDAGSEHFELGPGDIMALPGWTPHQMTAIEQSVVFAFSDRPAHEALGLWREARSA